MQFRRIVSSLIACAICTGLSGMTLYAHALGPVFPEHGLLSLPSDFIPYLTFSILLNWNCNNSWPQNFHPYLKWDYGSAINIHRQLISVKTFALFSREYIEMKQVCIW